MQRSSEDERLASSLPSQSFQRFAHRCTRARALTAVRRSRRDLLSRFLSSREREIERFRVAVSVPAGEQMRFLLTYEELLPRRLGRYELSLGLRPGQLVQNLSLEVSITEQTGIAFIKVLPLKTSRLLSSSAQGEETLTMALCPFPLTVLRLCCSRCRSPGLHSGGADRLLRSGFLQSHPAAADRRLLQRAPGRLRHPV